jgi:hypothetical protein
VGNPSGSKFGVAAERPVVAALAEIPVALPPEASSRSFIRGPIVESPERSST